MSSYQSGSLGDGKTVSGFEIQGPKPLPKNVFPVALSVSSSIIAKNPNGVILMGSGSFHFLYSSTSAVDTVIAAGGISSGTEVYGYASQSIELPISPCAWSGSGNAVPAEQNVIFIYTGGL